MPGSILKKSGASTLLVAALVVLAGPTAASAAPDFQFVLSAGVACDFEIQVSGSDDQRVIHTFTDAAGNTVRTITAGKGSDLTFANLDNGEVVTLAAKGAVTREVFNPDGSSTVVATGHTVLIMTPTDVPAGPSTTLYTGRVTYTSTATDDFTILKSSGKTRDICAELG